MFNNILNKVRNYIFGEKIKELNDEIAILRSNLKGKVNVYCDNTDCFEHNGNKSCGLAPSLFLNNKGVCKEYMQDCMLDEELKVEVSKVVQLDIRDPEEIVD
jgi:hypothetical protein